MDKVDQLLIRACKSDNSKRKLYRLYKKFYMDLDENNAQKYIIKILSDIVDTYCPISTYDLYCGLSSPLTFPWIDDKRTTEDKMYDLLISRIACTRRDGFEGLSSPTSIRNRDE